MQVFGVFLIFILSGYCCGAASLPNVLYARFVCALKSNGHRTLVPGSCNQYYECQGGRAKLRSCPYYFDGHRGVCVSENPGCVELLKASQFVPAGCSSPCCGVASGYVVDTIHPQIYYKCQYNHIEEEHECEPGMVFNSVKMQCDVAVITRDKLSRTSPKESEVPAMETNNSDLIEKERLQKAKERADVETYLNMVCLAKPNGFQLASLTNCHEFYMCHGGQAVLQSCGQNYYNGVKNMCDLPENSECILNVIRSSASQDEDTKLPPQHTSPPKGQGSLVPNSIELYQRFVCRGKPDGELLISLTQCQEYLQCQGGKTIMHSCGPLLHFNAHKGICDLPENSHCLLGQKATSMAGKHKVKDTPSPTELYERFVCRDKPNGHQLISLTSCHEYYICQAGKVQIHSCGSKYFNIDKGECDLPENSKCLVSPQQPTLGQQRSIIPTDDLYQRFVCRDKMNGVRLISIHSCHDYFTCQDGKAVLHNCGENYFNAHKGICDLPENTKCLLNSQNSQLERKSPIPMFPNHRQSLYERFACRGKPDGHILISPQSCHEFYECRQEKVHVRNCGAKYYNHALGLCDLPENTRCQLEKQPYVSPLQPSSTAPLESSA